MPDDCDDRDADECCRAVSYDPCCNVNDPVVMECSVHSVFIYSSYILSMARRVTSANLAPGPGSDLDPGSNPRKSTGTPKKKLSFRFRRKKCIA